jgi:hypothetical protein
LTISLAGCANATLAVSTVTPTRESRACHAPMQHIIFRV